MFQTVFFLLFAFLRENPNDGFEAYLWKNKNTKKREIK